MTTGHGGRRSGNGLAGLGRAARILAAVSALGLSGCGSAAEFLDSQRALTAPPEIKLPVWANGNTEPLSVPAENETAAAEPGDVVLKRGLTLRNGGLVALTALTIEDGSVEYNLREGTYFPPIYPDNHREPLSYCYRDLCLQIVNETVRFRSGRDTGIATESFLIVPPSGRIIAIGLARELSYLGVDGGDLLFRFRQLRDGEEVSRRELTIPARPGAVLRHRGALIDVIALDGDILEYRVVQTFRG